MAEPEIKIEANLNLRRYNFGTAIQLKDDTLDDYFYRLEILAKHCDYNDMTNDLIRDRFIIGINDTKLREKLLEVENLTLDDLIEIANITIKKKIEFVTVIIDEQIKPETDELMPEIKLEKNPNEKSQNLAEKIKKPTITIKVKSSSNKPLEPLNKNKCHKCNETFRSPNYLFQHILLVHSLKFLCKICKAKFHSSEDLKKHVNIYHKTGHTTAEEPTHIHDQDDYYSSDDPCISANEKQTYPYMCELCAKIIKNHEQSVLHKMEHEGIIKPYLCMVCGMTFKAVKTLKEHEMVHTGTRPFICPICKRNFVRNYALKCHMWRIHKIERVKKKKNKNIVETVILKDVANDINSDTFQDN